MGQEPTQENAEGQEPAGDSAQEAQQQEQNEPRTFDEAYVKDLRKEAAQARARAKEAEGRLRELTDQDKTEQERLTDRLAEAERRATDAEARALRYEVAADNGLDLKSAGFLVGTTREEIEAKASELASLLKERVKPAAGFDGGARKTPEVRRPPEEEHNSLLLDALGRGS